MVSMAATITDFPFLLSLSLLFFVSFSRFPPTASSTDVPLTVSAKATVVQYWNRVFGSDSPPPSTLLAHVPSISPLDIITNFNEHGIVSVRDFKSHDNIRSVMGEGAQKKGDDNYLWHSAGPSSDGSQVSPNSVSSGSEHQGGENIFLYSAGRGSDGSQPSPNSPHRSKGSPNSDSSGSGHQGGENIFLHSAGRGSDGSKASPNSDSSVSGHQGGENWFLYSTGRGSDGSEASPNSDSSGSGHQGGENWFLYSTGIHARSYRDDQVRQSNSQNEVRGIFFRESQLREGETMPIADYGSQVPHLSFLPRYIASRIPMSADAIRKHFHIPADAPMGKAVASTIDHCKSAPVKGETMRCITSAEDMIDYVATSLGTQSHITARSTNNSIRLGGNVLIGEVKAANGGKLGHVVSCHQATFPYLLYRCHSVPKTKLYDVEILDPDTKEKVSAAAAICHFDTSVWSPSHVAFTLGFEQGLEICHWVFPGAMAWTAAAE